MIENRIDIYGDNRFPEHSKVREACRGIVIRDGLILLTYEVNTDQWFIPGGGLEGNETIQQCCIRELAEETGFVVNPLYQFATINEYYEEWKYISNYFICEITGETQRLLTSYVVDEDVKAYIMSELTMAIMMKYDPTRIPRERRH